ncbi:MAG: hypothetical protein PVSMB9_02750 [Candidatus Dormibacteria bacterium]
MDKESMRPMLFWIGLVLIFLGLAAAWLYILGPHISIFGPGRHIKHGLLAIAIAVAGGVLASFYRPRTDGSSGPARYNR